MSRKKSNRQPLPPPASVHEAIVRNAAVEDGRPVRCGQIWGEFGRTKVVYPSAEGARSTARAIYALIGEPQAPYRCQQGHYHLASCDPGKMFAHLTFYHEGLAKVLLGCRDDEVPRAWLNDALSFGRSPRTIRLQNGQDLARRALRALEQLGMLRRNSDGGATGGTVKILNRRGLADVVAHARKMRANGSPTYGAVVPICHDARRSA